MSSVDPMNVHFENIIVEGYSLRIFYNSRLTFCNYPEAFLNPVLNFRNIRYILSKEMSGTYNTMFYYTSSPGNITATNMNSGDFSTSALQSFSFFFYLLDSNCSPDDGLIQNIVWDDFKSTFSDPIGQRYLFNIILVLRPHYRKMFYDVSNFEFNNSYTNFNRPFIGGFGSELDTLNIRNLWIQN